MTLRKKICSVRKNRGFSQEALAENSGVSLRTIQRIENNKSKPRPYTLKIIADTLTIKMEELVFEQKSRSDTLVSKTALSKISLINSSALLGVLIPSFNIIAPVILWKLNKENPLINEKGKKIISFQILWFFLTALLIVTSHFFHYKITGEFVTGRIPFVIIVYMLLLLLNIFFIIKSSVQLKNKNAGIFSFIPDLF